MNKKNKFTEILEQIIESITEAYIEEFKMPEKNARHAAEIAVEMIRQETSGSVIYMSKGHIWAVTEKYRHIYRKFNGTNHGELAKEYGLTARQIYNIIKKCQLEDMEKKQMKLFG